VVIKLDVRKFLHGGSRMLTRDLFAVANLSVSIWIGDCSSLRLPLQFDLAWAKRQSRQTNGI